MAKQKFNLTLTIGSKTFKSTGETALECLNNLKTPKKYDALGLFTLTNEGKEAITRIYPTILKRVFVKDVDRALLAKRLMTLL